MRRCQQVDVDLLADDRGEPERFSGLCDDKRPIRVSRTCLQQHRDANVVDRAEPPAPVFHWWRMPVALEFAEDLAGEEGVALGVTLEIVRRAVASSATERE